MRITFSPDGKRMLWGAIGWSGGTVAGTSTRANAPARGWSTPRAVSFNSTANDFDPSFAPDGSGVYFFSNRDGGFGKDDIYFAPFDARTGRYGAAENLGAAINSAGDEWAPVVSPDGKRLHVRERRPRRARQARPVHRAAAPAMAGSDIENLEALNTPDEDFDATFLHDGVSVVYTSGKFEGDEVALYVAEFRDGRFQPRERLPVGGEFAEAGSVDARAVDLAARSRRAVLHVGARRGSRARGHLSDRIPDADADTLV